MEISDNPWDTFFIGKRQVDFVLASTSALPSGGIEALVGLGVIPTDTVQWLKLVQM